MEKPCPEKDPAPSIRSQGILPEKYGANRVVLLPVAPGKVHVYWEFVLQQPCFAGRDSCNQPFSGDDPRRTRAVLRFYQVADKAEAPYLDLEVDSYSGNRYVDIPTTGGVYVVAFGFKAATGDFFPAIRSEAVETSPLVPTAEPDAVFATVAAAAMPVSGGDVAVKSDGSSGVVARTGQLVKETQDGKLSAVSASANIEFLSAALKDGISSEEIRSEMDRLCRLTLGSEDDLVSPFKPKSVDLTALCEKRFLFGNSSK